MVSRYLSPLLALVGHVISGYLLYVHYNLDALVCAGGGCEVVQTSRYSEVFGIPISLFGVLLFLALLGLMFVRERMPVYQDNANLLIVVMLFTAVMYWAYLSYLEAFVIQAWCQWCVITSLVTLVMLFIEGWGMARYFTSDTASD